MQDVNEKDAEDKLAVHSLVPDHVIKNQIYFLRGQKVMLDYDLAKLYRVHTKVFKQAIKRNTATFPADFMLELTPEEFEILRSRIVTSKPAIHSNEQKYNLDLA